MFQSLTFLSCHLFMHHLSCSHFLVIQLCVLLVTSFLLLLFDHWFNHCSFGGVLIILVVEHFFSLHFFFFSIANLLFDLLTVSTFIFVNVLLLGFFHRFIIHCHVLFFLLFLLYPILFFHSSIHVSPSLVHNVSCLLSSLINLFVRSVFLLL